MKAPTPKQIINFFRILLLSVMSLALIGAGWFQEVTWYFFVLTGNGLPDEFAYIAGGSLSLLLCYFAIKKMKVPFISLLLFSMLFTVIGQNQEYREKRDVYSSQTAKEQSKEKLYSYYTDKIQETNKAIQHKNSQIPEDVEDQAEWITNGVNPLRKDIAKLEIKLSNYEAEMKEIVLSDSEITEPKTSYDNFAEDIGFISPTLLRYFIMVFTSLFIGLMAPSGFAIIGSAYGVKKEPVQKPKKEKRVEVDNQDLLLLYTDFLFRDEENPSTLRGRTSINKDTGITQHYFNTQSKLAKSLGLIKTSGNGNLTTANVTRTEFVMMMRNKTAYRGNLTAVL